MDKSSAIDRNRRMKGGQDPDCTRVQKATAHMTMDQASEWFCRTGVDQHDVFNEEHLYVNLYWMPIKFRPTHKKLCRKWIRRHKKPIPFPCWEKRVVRGNDTSEYEISAAHHDITDINGKLESQDENNSTSMYEISKAIDDLMEDQWSPAVNHVIFEDEPLSDFSPFSDKEYLKLDKKMEEEDKSGYEGVHDEED